MDQRRAAAAPTARRAQAAGAPNQAGGTRAAVNAETGTGPAVQAPVVAPEVAAQIMARRQTGESVAQLAGTFHLTPAEVLRVIRNAVRDAEPAEPVQVAP